MQSISAFEKISSTSSESLLLAHISSVTSYRCLKRLNQIICPTDKSPLSSLHLAVNSNNSLKLGPNMYHRQFIILNDGEQLINSAGVGRGKNLFNIHSIFYTKQYDDSLISSSSSNNKINSVANVFDLSDQEEHEFMHEPNVEENVIDDGHQVRKVNKVRINTFIEENKAMIRRMFGDYHHNLDLPDSDDLVHNHQHHHRSSSFMWEQFRDHYSSFHYGPDSKSRRPKRSIKPTPLSGNKVDSCESSVEIVTPYWASNSAGKIRAIVNTQHLQQAIQQEVCQAVQTRRCNKDCRCEQKYKWHRLLAYDPDDDCKGIFMDWFLFPSCCVCRCTKY